MAEQIGKNWAGFRFEEVLEATGARLFTQRQDPENLFLYTNSVVSDSRQFCGEQLFVALKGERFDGHDYVDKAAKESAVGAVVEREIEAYWPSGLRIDQFVVPDTQKALGDLARFHRKRFQIPLVAVTGSYGKTSTRALIHAALSQKFDTLTSQGNFNNEIGLPMTLFQLEEKHQAAVVEMGMRGRGQIEYLTKIAEPTVGVITNIGPQHIELLGSVEEIAAAKAELIENLPENGLAVLPADSPFLPFLTGKTECKLVTFGAAEWADYRVQNIETRPDGNISCEINRQKIHLPLPGAHNAINAAAAFAVALELGVSPEEAARGLENAELPGARMRVEKLPNGITLIDDCYNAGPDSTRAALQTLLDFPGGGRRVVILGAMRELGEHSESEHRKIGSLAGQICDVLIGVGGDTRPLLNSALESAQQIEREMPVFYCDDAKEAANRVGEWLQKGDVLLVKGSRSVGLELVVGAATNLKQ